MKSRSRNALSLKRTMRESGHELSNHEALALAALAEVVANKLRAEERWERVRKGMVANWTMQMRSVGAWDGE